MLSHEGAAVACTANLNCAVALATFGFPCRLERLRDDPTGDVVSCLWHFGPQAILFQKSRPDEPMPAITAHVVLRGIRDGAFEAADPGHPICDVIHGLNIYERLRTYMERATPYRIASTAAPGRYTLIEGAEPAADVPRPAVRTDSIELAAALIRMGHPLLGVDGIRPHRRIALAAASYDPGAISAAALAEQINTGALQAADPSHPALWVIVGLRNRISMRREIEMDAIPRLIRNPRSLGWVHRRQSSILPAAATGKDIDLARRDMR